jgi:sugar-specific transcriptional regulator TrmB
MNQKRIIRSLLTLRFRQCDAEVYAFLSEMGPQSRKNIADALKLPKHQLYRSLKNLRSGDMISASIGRPTQFSVVPLEKIMDSLIEAKKEQAVALQESKEALLFSWRVITKERQ